MLLMGIIWGGIKLTSKNFQGMLKISNYKNPDGNLRVIRINLSNNLILIVMF